jgi:hypothetical protein
MPTMPQPQRFYTPAQMAGMRPSPRWQTGSTRPGGQVPAAAFAMQPPFRAARGPLPAGAGGPTGMRLARMPGTISRFSLVYIS